MDAVVLTWRWQNILSIWIMVIALGLLVVTVSKVKNSIGQKNGSV